MILTKERCAELLAQINRSEIQSRYHQDWINLLDTIEAQAQTIAELESSWRVREGGHQKLYNDMCNRKDATIAELTVKLDAVRGFANKWGVTVHPTVLRELLSILDAPTKPKEARNER